MSQAIKTRSLPATMDEKLRSIRRRQTALVVARALAIGASVLIGAMLGAMALDWWFTLFNTAVRTALTVTSLGLAVVATLAAGVRPLVAVLGWKSAASSADEEVPELEERWTTVASFAESDHQPTTEEGRAMLEQVTSEAVTLGRLVKPQRVARPQALKPAVTALLACIVVLAGFLALDWARTSVLLRRFWSPTALITATQLNNVTGDVTVPRGESLDLVTEQSGLLSESALLTLEYDTGTMDVFELETGEEPVGSFRHVMRTDDSFRYRVRAGDDRTEWRTVTVIDYPALEEVQFTVTAPEYVDRPPFEKTLIPGRVRVVQGSRLELAMKPLDQLDRLELTLSFNGEDDEETTQMLSLTPGADGWYRFESQLLDDVALSPALFNDHGLTNEDRPICRIQVIPDQAPVARVISPTDEMAVAVDETIDIQFEAHDDHGIATAELVVYDESLTEAGVEPQIISVQPIPLGDQQLQRHVLANTQLDLSALDIEEGMNISYAVRVTDNRDVAIDPDNMTAQRAEARPGEADDEQMLADASQRSGDAEQSSGTDDEADAPPDDLWDALDNALADARDSGSRRAGESAADPSNPRESNAASAESDAEQPGGNRTGTDSEGDQQTGADREPTTGEPSDGEDPQGNSPSEQSASDTDNPDGEPSDDGMPREAGEGTDVADGEAPDGDRSPTDDPSTDDPPSESVAQNANDSQNPDDADGNDSESQSDRQSLNVASRTESEAGDNRPGSPAGETDSDMPGDEETPDDTDAAVANAGSDDGMPNDEGSPDDAETTLADSDADMPKDEASPNSADTAVATDSENPDSESSPEGDSTLTQSGGDQNAEADGNQSSGSASQGSQTAQTESGEQEDESNREPGQPQPPLPFSLDAQQAQGGQNTETNRRTLKITERMAALAEAAEGVAAENMAIRDKVVLIDRMLAGVEAGLVRVVQREIPDSERGAQFGTLDEQLGGVESYVAELRDETRDGQFAFVGLQMVDIGRTHVTPARDRVFAAIRDTAGVDSHATDALQHIVRARELLSALLERFDAVVRERELADDLDESITMYEVYVEKMQQLMREARQTRNPLERKMGIIEVDQDYLDRYAEVLTLRREMLAEFARMLADDPRLLAKYLDLIKRRRDSLRDQLTELAERQYDASTELSGWLLANDDQRRDLWMLVAEMRLQTATTLARDAAELAERLDKQMPLVLEPDVGTAARVIEHAENIAGLARDIAFDAESVLQNAGLVGEDSTLLPNSEQLVWTFSELDAALDRLNFENEQEEEVTDYASGRLLESRTVADQAAAWLRIARFIDGGQYHGLVQVDQEQIAVPTELLRVEMLNMEDDLNGQFQDQLETDLPGEIVDMIRELHRIMEGITFHQESAAFALSREQLEAAELQQAAAMDGFERAEELFDRIRRAVVDALDEYDPEDPNIADLEDPTLDEFLANLEREPNIEALLGIPDRPRNLRIIAESMTWQEEGGEGLGQAMDAAIARAREAMRRQRNAGADEEEQENPREMTDEERERQMAAEEMQEMIDRSLASIQEQIDDPATSEEERRRLEQMADSLRQMRSQNGQPNNNARDWERLAQSDEAREILRALALGQPIPDQQWNRLMSTLEDGLWQVQGRTPPEDYREAIEQYQERIRQLVDTFGEDTE